MSEASEAQVQAQQPGTLDKIIDWTVNLGGQFVDYTRATTSPSPGAAPVTSNVVPSGIFDIKLLFIGVIAFIVIKKLMK